MSRLMASRRQGISVGRDRTLIAISWISSNVLRGVRLGRTGVSTVSHSYPHLPLLTIVQKFWTELTLAEREGNRTNNVLYAHRTILTRNPRILVKILSIK
jgi:hypothetical protein